MISESLVQAVKAAFPEADVDAIKPDLQLGRLAGWDSMNAVNLLLEINERCGVDIEGFSLKDSTTIGDLATAIGGRRPAAATATSGAIHLSAIVDGALIGVGSSVDSGAVIRAGAIIGKNCRIHPGVIIESWVTIGDDCEIFPHALLGKEARSPGVTARAIREGGHTSIGNGCQIGPNAVIYRGVRIGNRCLIGDCASIREQTTIGDQCIISRCVTINYEVVIGNRVKIMDLTHVTGRVLIEDDVFISVSVAMANDNSLSSSVYDPVAVRGPTIRTGAFIGIGAILLPGIEVGSQSVVAAGSLVTKSLPAGVLVAGQPARVVKQIERQPG